MEKRCISPIVFVIILLGAANANLLAQWNNSPDTNNAICTAPGHQTNPTIISGVDGGSIVTWCDGRSGFNNIYAQRVNEAGFTQWTVNGSIVCSAAGDQDSPTIISDGVGGAIITWRDWRNVNMDIYVQRIDSTGALQWTLTGVPICTATNDQFFPTIISDNHGGAIISWYDNRNQGTTDFDIYAQRIDSAGIIQWPINGLPICTATLNQQNPTIVPDGSGGVIITWEDNRAGGSNIYAQRVNDAGIIQWTPDGIGVCLATSSQVFPKSVSDSIGGATITWQDYRTGVWDIYAQRIDSNGLAQWTPDGMTICTASSFQQYPDIISDGMGGNIITWCDMRSFPEYNFYAQRIDSLGIPYWITDGVELGVDSNFADGPVIVSAGFAGAIIAWQDYRAGVYDIYGQKINATGSVQWTSGGIPICTATAGQYYPKIVSDGSEGAILTWEDSRNGNQDVYVQRVNASGNLCANTDILGQVSYTGGYVTNGFAIIYPHAPFYAAFDTLQLQPLDAFGNYHFSDVTNGSYLVKIFPDTLVYPDSLTSTYFYNEWLWDSATVINHGCIVNDTANVIMIELNLGGGFGLFHGQIIEGYGFGRAPGDPISGIEVKVGLTGSEEVVAVTTTDINGQYTFNNIDFGTFTVYVDIPGLERDSSYTITVDSLNTQFICLDYIVDSVSIYYPQPCGSIYMGIESASTTEKDKFMVFPNPTTDVVNVVVNNLAGIQQIYIENMLGEVIISKELNLGINSTFIFDISNEPAGVYFLKLGNRIKRIIKQ